MLAKVRSCAVIGIDGRPVQVEVDITKKGFGAFRIVGLAGKAIDESRERVQTAVENSSLEFPRYRITVNLAPADLPKEGPTYDLPIAVGILAANEIIASEDLSDESAFFGELSLDGSLNSTPGILPLTMIAKEYGATSVFVPAINAQEAALVEGIDVYPVATVRDLVLHLNKLKLIEPLVANNQQLPISLKHRYALDEIKGQSYAKRALIIAAAGLHNIHFSGPPGSGKTMLARALPAILPSLTPEESLTVTKIHSIVHQVDPQNPLIQQRPYRHPHHTTSRIGLIGGGSQLNPGEISLAHHGVLFLDEMPEFPRSVIESLRQPLEDGVVTITRAKGSVTFPANFMLVAASNPCPCGYLGSEKKRCTCLPNKVSMYQRRLSGPMLDRIDITTFVREVELKEIIGRSEELKENGEKSETETARDLVQEAHDRQIHRFKKESISHNAHMTSNNILDYCLLKEPEKELLLSASEKMSLSARAVHKVLKVARTIADLGGDDEIKQQHLLEALSYRKTT